jgi:oxygen-dependent protoporphyrinogen oxidase
MGVPTTVGAARRAVGAGMLSWAGGVRAAVEPLLPGRPIGDPDEPAATVVGRRLGREAAVRLAEPLLRGVFGAPSTEVGVRSAYPRAVGHRSLARALRPPARTSDEPQFLALRGGFASLVEALAASLPPGAIRTATPVGPVTAPDDGGFDVGGLRADAVLLTAPAGATAASLVRIAPEAAATLREVRYGGSAVVVVEFPADALVRTLEGSGFLVDPEDGLSIAACSWYSSKWPHLTGGRTVLRAVVTDAGHLQADDDLLARRAAAEMGRVMGARSEPKLVRMRRWDRALPIFAPGHHDRIRRALGELPEHVGMAGAFLGAVGIPDCIEAGEAAARRLVTALARPASG